MVLAEGVAEADVPALAIIVGSDILMADVPHDCRHGSQPLLAKVLEEWLQNGIGLCLQVIEGDAHDGNREKCESHKLSYLKANIWL